MATARWIGQDMESGYFDVDRLTDGGELNRGLVADLALSVEAAVLWWVDFAGSGTLNWMPGMDEMLCLAGADERTVRARLGELVSPLIAAARAAAVWQDFALEQSFEAPDGGGTRWIQFRARTYAQADTTGVLGVATDVTSRHEHQIALTDLADRYRLLIELSPDGIAVHEAGIVVYANPAGIRMVGAKSASDIVGRPITDFVHSGSVPTMLQRIQTLDTPGAYSEPADALLQKFDGGTVDVESVSVRTTWNGRTAFQVIMRDITDHKAAAAALRFQAALVSHVSDAIVATTLDGTVTSWNPAAEVVYGHPAREVIGRSVSDVVGAPLDPLSILTAGGVVQSAHRRCDGSALEVRVSAAQMDDGYVLVCADETARRRAEQHYTTVVAAIEEGVVVISDTGHVESINPAAERILGVTQEHVVGLPSALADLYDENGDRLGPEDYPSAFTRRTGQAQNGRIIRATRPDDTSIWLSLSCRALAGGDGPPPGYVVSFTDITERRAMDARLAREATHDALTGLVNRTVVISRLAKHTRSPLLAALFIDLDKFKVINDSLGHGVGDRVLQIIGKRLRRAVAGNDLVGRLGGDEFAVIAHDITDPDDAASVAERLRHSLSRPLTVEGRHLHVDASIGIVLVGPDDGRDGDDILRDADLAMYQAKTLGRSRYAFFDVELRERTQRRLQLEQDLRTAPGRGQLWLAYQPIVDLKTNGTTGVEALLRWDHPRYGAISPTEFIPLAEESDLINLVSAHMLRTATAETLTLRSRLDPNLRLAVNLSARQLDDPQLVPDVRRALADARLPGSALCLEITESAVMRDPDVAARTLAALRELGTMLAIDDFGTGYSSLAQLLRLPLDTLKIDQSFTAGLGRSKEAEAIVTSIIAMAHAVDLNVIAEGVESELQLDILRQRGCDQAQGYLLGRPVSAGDLVAATLD
jgi:diguanylate cyclase (GGDEF)-like protein/PAS domain S-box-containing protein